jgi:hypothetical protein
MAGKDFVNVKLTEFGAQQAGGGRVQVHAGNHSFYFQPGEVKMVTRAFEWERVLKNERFNGHPLFEIAPEAEEQLEPSDVQDGTQGMNADEIDVYPKNTEVGA